MNVRDCHKTTFFSRMHGISIIRKERPTPYSCSRTANNTVVLHGFPYMVLLLQVQCELLFYGVGRSFLFLMHSIVIYIRCVHAKQW